MHSLMVVRHGHVVAEGWWAPYSAGRPHLLYSLSKSFTSTAAAFAQAEGLLHPHRGHRQARAVSEHADRHGETIPVAASGGWLDDRTLRAEIIFLETPHRMDITCSVPGRTAEAGWRHPPLSPSKLQHLHCPA